MKRIRNLSVRGKLTFITMTVSTASLLLVSGIFLVMDVISLRHELLASVGTDAEMVGNNSTAALSFHIPHDATDVLTALRADDTVDAAWIYTPDGELFADFYRDRKIPAPPPELVREEASTFGKGYVQVCRLIKLNDKEIGTVVVRGNLNELNQRYVDYIKVISLAFAAATIVSLVLVNRLQRVVSVPILNLTETAKAISTNKNYTLRATPHGEDELGLLVTYFNQMLDEIQRQDVELKAHRDNLEDQVALRTGELTRVNTELISARDHAEQASRAKSAFLANMSHEIRTPMTAIVGYADMMLEPDQTLSDRQDCLQIIRRNAALLLDLINDILDLSKIEADKMSVERISTDLPHLAAEVSSLMRPRAKDKGLAFELKFSDPLPRTILTDPLRLKQILVNLLNNAVKFTASGRVSISMTHVASPDGKSSKIRFAISDTGIGMAKDQIPKLFQAFSQADDSMTRRYGGTGLGLIISRRLASLLGGEITVQSAVGVGTTFIVEIDSGPLENVEMLHNVSESLLGSVTHSTPLTKIKLNGRILFAEDGLDNQRLISTHLRRAGADVTIANNGKEALDLLGKEHFDIVLMDMQMPILDGYAAATQMRQKGFKQPIIALTAHAMAEDRAKCLKAGCTDYLTKPIDREKLLRTVWEHLANIVGTHAAQSQSDQNSQPGSVIPPSHQIEASGAKHRSEYADDPSMKELVDGFVERLPVEVAKLHALLKSGEIDALRRVAHQLKGSGGGYGFSKLTQLAAIVDKSIKESASIELVRREIDELVSFIRSIDGYVVATEEHLPEPTAPA